MSVSQACQVSPTLKRFYKKIDYCFYKWHNILRRLVYSSSWWNYSRPEIRRQLRLVATEYSEISIYGIGTGG